MSTIKEKLQAIKAIFNTVPPPQSEAPMKAEDATAPAAMIANVVGYPVDGGTPVYTDISDDNIAGLDANDYVFTDESMATPYADGTYTVTGTDFSFTISGGQIVSIDNPSGMGAGQPLPDIDEPVNAASVVPPAPTTTDVPVNKPAVSPESMKALYSKQDDLKADIEALTLKLAKQESFSKQVLELLELVASQPTTEPKTLAEPKKDGFNARKEAQLEKMAKAIAEAKAKQKFS
jgi:hypothetical protein